MDSKYLIKGLTLEAVSEDISLTVRGIEMSINSVDNISAGDNNLVIISKYYEKDELPKDCTWILLDRNNKVLKKNTGVIKKNFVDGYIVIGKGEGAYFLNERFKEGDIIKIRLNDDIVSIDDITNRVHEHKEDLIIKGENFLTVNESSISIELDLLGLKANKSYVVSINDRIIEVENKSIINKVNLTFGINSFNIKLYSGEQELVQKYLVVYRRRGESRFKDNILWIDQFPGALQLNSLEDIDDILKKAKEAGFTACSIDVKGPEGYVSYKKNDVSNSPYISKIKVSHKKGMNPNRDLLEDFIMIAKKYGIKVYAAINVMTEGNLVANDFPLIEKHKDWEEILQRPEDKGKLLTVRESSANNILLYINPSNDEAIEYQLKRYEEVLKNYDVDGVVLDRCRYDNAYADFSELTRRKFETFLNNKNKKLIKWPDDVFKVQNDGEIIEGKHYLEWWTFRAQTIKDIAKKIKEIVDKYSDIKDRKIEFASYVGSWYDIIYQNGINWASKNFRYDQALGFGEDRIYNDDYYNTAYIEYLDFIMIGTYYKQPKEINKYITIGNILTMEEIPILAGMSLPDLDDVEIQENVYKAALESCNGTMTFDLSYIDWPKFKIRKKFDKK